MSVLYHGQTLMIQKLTESRFGKTKFGFPIEIRGDLKNEQSTESLMSAGICNRKIPIQIENFIVLTETKFEKGSKFRFESEIEIQTPKMNFDF
jgi:hypothetical protein